jgi:hypothetical protein
LDIKLMFMELLLSFHHLSAERGVGRSLPDISACVGATAEEMAEEAQMMEDLSKEERMPLYRPMAIRYDVREDKAGGWTVFDRFTAMPVKVKGTLQTGLLVEVADDLVDLLNTLDRKRREADSDKIS